MISDTRIPARKEKQKFGINLILGNEVSEKKFIGEHFNDVFHLQLQHYGCKLQISYGQAAASDGTMRAGFY